MPDRDASVVSNWSDESPVIGLWCWVRSMMNVVAADSV
jgi:hypothetical protein